jgi:AcrR family transcriptional regulator
LLYRPAGPEAPVSTRDRILDAALALFNEAGTAAASTNHVAAAAAISPGNLYYHFRNKEAIIRDLFERLFARWDAAFALPDDRPLATADLLRLVRANFAVMWDYRFAYRELIPLIRRDELLRDRWLAVRRRGYAGFRALVAVFVAAGVLRAPADPDAVERLADLCWLISEFWLASLEVSGLPVNADQLERGVALMLQVLAPVAVDPSDAPTPAPPPD